MKRLAACLIDVAQHLAWCRANGFTAEQVCASVHRPYARAGWRDAAKALRAAWLCGH